MSFQFTIEDLIGVPYRVGGRGPADYDCAGLVIELQARQGRILRIPDTGETRLSDHLAMRHVLRLKWRELRFVYPGCIVFFPSQAHVGTMIDARRFLHTTSEMGAACIEDLAAPRWKRARRSFYTPEVQR